jgi:hypothetical protein
MPDDVLAVRERRSTECVDMEMSWSLENRAGRE